MMGCLLVAHFFLQKYLVDYDGLNALLTIFVISILLCREHNQFHFTKDY